MIKALKGFIEITFPGEETRMLINITNISYVKKNTEEPKGGIRLFLTTGDDIWIDCDYEEFKKILLKAAR